MSVCIWCEHMHVCVPVHRERRLALTVFLGHSSLYYLKQTLSLSRSSPVQLVCLDSLLQEFPIHRDFSRLPHPPSWLLCEFWRPKLQSLHFYDKSIIHWAIFLVHCLIFKRGMCFWLISLIITFLKKNENIILGIRLSESWDAFQAILHIPEWELLKQHGLYLQKTLGLLRNSID